MNDILHWVRPDEFPSLFALICLLAFIGGRMARPGSLSHRQATWCAGAAILLFTGAGIYTWAPSTPGDYVEILTRAAFAAGIAFGSGLLVLGAAHQILGHAVAPVIDRHRASVADRQRRAAEDRARRDTAERQRREREDQARRLPLLEQERQRATEEAARAERERHAQTDKPRSEVMTYYDTYAELLTDSLPRPLFISKLQSKFPPTVTPEQAWQAAQDMILEMLPMIDAARAKKRAEEEERRNREEEAAEEDRKRKEPDERRQAPSRLTDWYERERADIERRLPDGPERDGILCELFDRYDQLMKETLREIKS